MRFAMLCYADGSVRWDKATDDAVMARHVASQKKLEAEGKLGPSLRLMPTSTAVTIRAGAEPMVLDGPFAETKEVLLGFWVFDAGSLEEAIEIGKEFASHNPGGALELRPVLDYMPGLALR